MEKKVCSKCKEEKELCDFSKLTSSKDGYKHECKLCVKNYYKENKEYILDRNKKWKKNNENKIKISLKEYYKKNKQKLLNYHKEYYEENKPSIMEKMKTYYLDNLEKKQEYIKNYRKDNKDKINERLRNYRKIKRKEDILYKLSQNLSHRLRQLLKTKTIIKNKKTEMVIGCDKEFLKEHLEKQFKDGMSWENYGYEGWHIDHIIPLASAKNKEEVYELCHYSNLQPLWAKENMKKNRFIR